MMIEIIEGVVEDVFGAVCREYGLQVARISPREVALISREYAIYFFTEPNEENAVSIEYFDISDRPDSVMMSYDLGLFLGAKRPVPPPPKTSFVSDEQRMRAGFKRICEHFREKGEDVLRGEKGWLKDYPPTWGIFPVESKLETAIRRVLKEGDLGSSITAVVKRWFGGEKKR